MQYITPYIDAIKNLKKIYYLTPFLLFMYASLIMILWQPVTRFINDDHKVAMDFVIFTLTFIQVYGIRFIQMFLYPHASFFIQSTRLYQKVFGTTWGTVKYGFFNYINIGKNIPDDYSIRGSSGTRYTVSSGYKSKADRVHDARTLYGLYLIVKFFFKDIMLRLFIHLGIFIISPILFLVAIPVLNKNGLLEYIEK